MNDPSLHLRSLPDRLPISLGDLREFAGVARTFRTVKQRHLLGFMIFVSSLFYSFSITDYTSALQETMGRSIPFLKGSSLYHHPAAECVVLEFSTILI